METFTVTLEGGSPWGFSIQGGVDHRSPLRVGKVTSGGRASNAGLVAGDYILSINNEDSKKLKHLQAQQIIKKSTHTVTLICSKVRPGITSPAVSSSSFSFPASERGGVTTPPRQPVTKAQPISRPKPPQAPPHARSASTGTSSECTTAGSSSPQSNVDVYDVKFQGMDAVCIDHSHPQENGVSGTDKSQQGMDLTCIDRSHPMQNGNCSNQNLGGDHAISKNANTTHQHGKVDNKREQVEAPPAIQFKRLTKDALASAINQAAAARVRRESSGEREEPSSSTSGVSSSQVPVTEEPVVQTQQVEQPLMYQLDAVENTVENTVQVTEPVVQEKQSDPPVMYQLDGASAADESNSVPPTSQAKENQHKSDDVFVEDGAVVVEERVTVVEQEEKQPLMYTFNTQSEASSNKAAISPKQVKPRKEEEPVAIVKKDPGWYKQMFQQFQNTVEEQFPGATSSSTSKSSTDDPSYVYDYRGLKVRKDSLTRTKPEDLVEERTKKNPTPDEEPVYTYDYRGLRVRADSTSKVQDSTTSLITPESHTSKPRPRSASEASSKASVPSDVSKDDVLSQSKQATSYKTQRYNTGASREYWNEKDKDHQEWNEKLKQSQEQQSQEQVHHQHSHSGSEDYTTTLTHMHPLLRQAAQESTSSNCTSSTTQQAVVSEDQPKLFERIEASKLQEAVSNASTMGQLQSEGVPSHLIPAVIDAQKEAAVEAAAVKKEKPPPGPMAKALFDFSAQSSKELSFNKGDFLELVHTIDDNWLGARIDGNEGIIPRNYVKVLTMQQYQEMLLPEAPKPTQLAVALFDFQGQSDREISFQKGDELHIEKKIDANWYEGFCGDARGIFPVAYVQITEGSH